MASMYPMVPAAYNPAVIPPEAVEGGTQPAMPPGGAVPSVNAAPEGVPSDSSYESKTHIPVFVLSSSFVQVLSAPFQMFKSGSKAKSLTEHNLQMLELANGSKSALNDKIDEIMLLALQPTITPAEKERALLLQGKYQFEQGLNQEALHSFSQVNNNQKSVGACYLEARAHHKLGIEGQGNLKELMHALLNYELVNAYISAARRLLTR